MAKMTFKKVPFAISAIGFVLCLSTQAQTLKTPAEEANFLQYSQHEEIARFLSSLAFLSKEVTVQVIGKTKEVKGFPSKDLYLCTITEEGAATPQAFNKNKLTLMVTAAQHGNEQAAKEAALRLIRDIALGDLKPLLKKMNFLFIAQANPYGNFFDVRQNEIEMDMNRDHVKLEAEGVVAIHRVFRAFLPEVTMDVHEKGDDYYRVSIGCVSNINISPALLGLSRTKILPEVEKNLEAKNLTFHEYLVTSEMGIDTSAGANYRAEDLAKRETLKRYSTTDLNDGRNSPGIYETLSFIQEGASRHDLGTLQERTGWQYFGIRLFAEAVAKNSADILGLVRNLRKGLIEKAMVYSDQNRVHLRMDYVRDEKTPTLALKKFETTESPVRGVLKFDKKAGDLLTAADLAPYPLPAQAKVVTDVVKNWFPDVESKLSVSRPLGYIIPAKHQDIIETLLGHGITVAIFMKDKPLDIEAYAAAEVVPSKYDYLPPEKIGVEIKTLQTIVKKGDFYVSCAQPAANLIPCLLEPESEYGFIRYWKFKIVPDAGGIFAFYRLVESQDLPVAPYKNWRTIFFQ
jgi:hypothetical protein